MLACLTATAAALRPPPASSVLRAPSRARSGPLVAQWVPCVDEASGGTYYYNELTGESQWDAPLDATGQSYGAQILWRLKPVSGAHSPTRRGGVANLRVGEEETLGRFDMIEQSVYVSRAQCVVQVAADGTANLTSLGKPPTLVRAHDGEPWYGLEKDETHVLADGQEICLTGRAPNDDRLAVFRCRCQSESEREAMYNSMFMGTGTSTSDDVQYGHDVQYSEDGLWMWNGAEWVPAQ